MSESPQQRASLLAPMPGDVIAQADIPDPAFAGGAMGVGFGVVPEENTVVAPVSGRITMVADTGHAVGFETADGLQVLIDAGVKAVVQPGGSVRDQESIDAAKAAGITMYLTGTRHFAH